MVDIKVICLYSSNAGLVFGWLQFVVLCLLQDSQCLNRAIRKSATLIGNNFAAATVNALHSVTLYIALFIVSLARLVFRGKSVYPTYIKYDLRFMFSVDWTR